MKQETAKKIEAMIKDQSTIPAELMPVFTKLIAIQKAFVEVEKGMAETQQRLQQLAQDRDRMTGAGEVLSQIISESLETEDAVKE